MSKIEQLVGLLKRLNAGEDQAKVKEEAKEFLASIAPEDLAIAEQKLIELGLNPEDLRRLCAPHLEVFKERLGDVRATLSPEHVVYTLMREHDVILGYLEELEKVNRVIQGMKAYEGGRDEFGKLRHIAEHLVEAEPHHKREEDVLFPALEERGVFGPPQVMRMEHEELRARKRELKELAENAGKVDFESFKRRLDSAAKFVVSTLQDHIFKENNILYPTALRVIEGEDVWRGMKSRCDEIGYCCFTPAS